jgi:hypothetical protein
MTVAEIVSFIRLQISEEREAFYSDNDIELYIDRALARFLKKTGAGIYKQTITIDPSKIGPVELPEIISISVGTPDVTDTLNSKYIVLYDGTDTPWAFYFDTNGTSTAPTGYANVIKVTISTGMVATAIGTALTLAITNAVTATGSSPFFALQQPSLIDITVTNNTAGNINNTSYNANATTTSGTILFSVTQYGVDDSYDLDLPFLRERSLALVLGDGTRKNLNRIAYEDYIRTSDDKLLQYYACYIDTRRQKLFISPNMPAGNIYLEYHVGFKAGTASQFLDGLILQEEYHEAIQSYGVYLAYKKDKELQLANTYLQEYLDYERNARHEVEEQLVNPLSKDWTFDNTNIHSNSLLQGYIEI